MDLFKLDKYDKYFIAFILVIITLFNIGQCFASENVELTKVNGIYISSVSNAYQANPDWSVQYFYAEKGNTYSIHLTGGGVNRITATSGSIPAVNVTYDILGVITTGETFNYVCTENCYIGLSNSDYWEITKNETPGINTAVDGLVNNVGVNQLWDVFGNGIDFIGVIVLVAFGLFLVFLFIKKLSKGKADF